MEHKTGCLVCGYDLVYLTQPSDMTCTYCGNTFQANVRCLVGHYVCDHCHSLSAIDLIEQYCSLTGETNPLKIANDLMKNPAIKMHGPEHHFLVPAVLLAAFYNQHEGDKKRKIFHARKRAENVLGGFCGFYGACGAGIGTGIFVSIVTGASPMSTEEWRCSNLMTASSLLVIAEQGGPRCCKRDTYLAIIKAGEFVRKELEYSFEFDPTVRCDFHPINHDCLRERCPFYLVETLAS